MSEIENTTKRQLADSVRGNAEDYSRVAEHLRGEHDEMTPHLIADDGSSSVVCPICANEGQAEEGDELYAYLDSDILEVVPLQNVITKELVSITLVLGIGGPHIELELLSSGQGEVRGFWGSTAVSDYLTSEVAGTLWDHFSEYYEGMGS